MFMSYMKKRSTQKAKVTTQYQSFAKLMCVYKLLKQQGI